MPRQPHNSRQMRQDDVAPAATILDVIAYYNQKIAPDLTVNEVWASMFMLDVGSWFGFHQSSQHLYICIVALHRAIQKNPDIMQHQWMHDRTGMNDSENVEMLHYHQACAARLLSEGISTATSTNPNHTLLSGVAMFLCLQVQQGAYTPWRSHLNGAHGLLNFWGERTCLGSHDSIYFTIMTTNIFGSTTTPSHLFSEDTIAQHLFYLDIIDSLQFESIVSLVPVPNILLKAVIEINLFRAKRRLTRYPSSLEVKLKTARIDADELLSLLQQFPSKTWAESTIHRQQAFTSKMSEDLNCTGIQASLEGWQHLAESFRMAIIIYLISSVTSGNKSRHASWKTYRAAAYCTLKGTIHWLCEQATNGGTLHKFILWPMVIAGIETVHIGDREYATFIKTQLLGLSRDLGTLAMRDAALFLDGLWSKCHDSGQGNSETIGWDATFTGAPLFVM
ncbi:hypothetical protein EsH8_VII_000017 [Colletotrichum jinshuiense]